MAIGYQETLPGGGDMEHLLNIDAAAKHWAKASGNAPTLDVPVAVPAVTPDLPGSIDSAPPNPAAAMTATRRVEDQRIGSAAKPGVWQRIFLALGGNSNTPQKAT